MEQIAEIAGTLIGIAYLYWEYKADDKVWLAGMLMPAISLVVYWQSGLYADFGLAIYYCLAAVYGWCMWKIKTQSQSESVVASSGQQGKGITHYPLRLILPAAFVLAAVWLLILAVVLLILQ